MPNRAQNTPPTPDSRRFDGKQIKLATQFFTWLAEHERTLACSQADMDVWHAQHSEHAHNQVRGFVLHGSGTPRQLRDVHASRRQAARRCVGL